MMPIILAATIAIEFIGPCSVKPLLETNMKQTRESNVGALTIDALENFAIEYKGSEAGLNSAFGTPVGMDAMEVVSDNEMRSYGWCFEVDGKVPADYADTISTKNVKRVRWFYGYAHYFNGKWTSMCKPAYTIKPKFLCEK